MANQIARMPSAVESHLSKKTRSLQDYDMLKRRYDQGGVTLRQTHLLQAF